MNYYEEIRKELVNNEVYKRVKDYSKNKSDLITYYNVGKLLIEAQGGEKGTGTTKCEHTYVDYVCSECGDVDKAKFYKNYIYIRVNPYIEYFNKSIHLNDKIEFTYKFNNEVKGEIENGL